MRPVRILYEGMRAALARVPLDGFSWPRPPKDGRGRRPFNDAPLIPAGFLERAATVYSDEPAIVHLSGGSTFRRIACPRLALAVAAEFSDSRKCLAALPSAGER
jgi:hypothetical protein